MAFSEGVFGGISESFREFLMDLRVLHGVREGFRGFRRHFRKFHTIFGELLRRYAGFFLISGCLWYMESEEILGGFWRHFMKLLRVLASFRGVKETFL